MNYSNISATTNYVPPPPPTDQITKIIIANPFTITLQFAQPSMIPFISPNTDLICVLNICEFCSSFDWFVLCLLSPFNTGAYLYSILFYSRMKYPLISTMTLNDDAYRRGNEQRELIQTDQTKTKKPKRKKQQTNVE